MATTSRKNGKVTTSTSQSTADQATSNQPNDSHNNQESLVQVTLVNSDYSSHKKEYRSTHHFQSNARYFTMCIYGLIFVALATIIIILIANWNNTSAFIGSFFDTLTPFIIAFFIAYILNPFVRRTDALLKRKLFKNRMEKGRKLLSITIVYLIVLSLITITLLYITPELMHSTEDIQKVYTKINVPEIEHSIIQTLDGLQEKYPQLNFQIIEDKINELIPSLVSYGTTLLTNLLSISFSIVRTLINIILAIVISCYMLSDKFDLVKNSKRMVYAMFPKKRAQFIVETAGECNTIFSQFIIGKAIDSLIIGIICFFLMTILRLDYAILFSVIVGITNMIPYFGPFIGAVPGVVIYTFIDPISAIIFAIMIFILQQFDGLYLGPKILGGSTGLTPLWVIFGITVGGAYGGVLGMFLGVPITAVVAYLLNKFITSRLEKKNLSDDIFETPSNLK